MGGRITMKLKYFMIMHNIQNWILLPLVLLCMMSCEKSEDNSPIIHGTVNRLGEFVKDQHTLMVTRKDTVVYRFDIMCPAAPIKKIELWQYVGTGINANQPIKLKTWDASTDKLDNVFTVNSSSLGQDFATNKDVQYSVYVEDMNHNYSSERLQIFVDVFSFSLTGSALYTGKTDATSKTFLNLESGRQFVIGNTISDPSGIDLGFAYLNNYPAEHPADACLVSFDQYWKTGIYNMFANEKNGRVYFRKMASMTEEEFEDIAITAADLHAFYEEAEIMDPPAGLNFKVEEEGIAANMQEDDIYAIKTRDGRYGMIRILKIDASSKGNENVQLSVKISKNR